MLTRSICKLQYYIQFIVSNRMVWWKEDTIL